MSYDRVVIIGKPGVGKTTLARSLSGLLHIEHVELDGIYWQPNWGKPIESDFQSSVSEALPTTGQWIADGDYSAVQQIVWSRADTAIWLDFPLWLTLWRLFLRIFERWFWQTKLWNDNQEILLDHLTSPNKEKNLFLWAIHVHNKHREEYPAILQGAYGHLQVLRFRRPAELDEWLTSLTNTVGLTASSGISP